MRRRPTHVRSRSAGRRSDAAVSASRRATFDVAAMGALIRLHLCHPPVWRSRTRPRNPATGDRSSRACGRRHRGCPTSYSSVGQTGSVSGSETPRSLSSATMTPTRHCGNGAPAHAMELLPAPHRTERKVSRPGVERFVVTSVDLGSLGLNDAGFPARWVPGHQDRVFANAPVGIPSRRRVAQRPDGQPRGGLGSAHSFMSSGPVVRIPG